MHQRKLKVKGPGLTRAIREAVNSRRELIIVYDRDDQGRLLRIGYYLSNESPIQPIKQNIKWFNKQEIDVLDANDLIPFRGHARLDIEYEDHKRQSVKSFLIEMPLDNKTDLVFRNIFRIKSDLIRDFMI